TYVTALSYIYTLSLHDALPILRCGIGQRRFGRCQGALGIQAVEVGQATFLIQAARIVRGAAGRIARIAQGLVALQVVGVVAQQRSEEHTSELQSRENLVCRLLL